VDRQIIKKSKQLSWLLRHGAYNQGLEMDEAGWMNIDDLLAFFEMSRAELELIVSTDNKGRFQLVGRRIRACQGHSVDNHAVTREGLEASWLEYVGDQPIWHGTTVATVQRIAHEGILPIRRTHVHCAPARDSIVGKRATSEVILDISPAKIREAGLRIFVAPNGVVLVRRIPPEAIVNGLALTKRAKRQEAGLRSFLAGC
jgi:putative RNA 2'-phosphotransferase